MPVSMPTRTTSDPNLFYFYPKRCKTLTFQRSFFSQTCRIWNQLPDEMHRKDITLCLGACSNSFTTQQLVQPLIQTIREHGNQCVSNVIQHVSLATPYRVATKLFLLIGPTVIGFISCCGLTRPHIDHACFFSYSV